MITVSDIVGRKMIDAVHVDLARGSSMWMGRVEGIDRLSVAKGQNRTGGCSTRWSNASGTSTIARPAAASASTSRISTLAFMTSCWKPALPAAPRSRCQSRQR